MKRSKSSLFILCIVGIFLAVYGTAVILRLIFGDFLLDGGLTNPNYSLLALLCAGAVSVLFTSQQESF